MDRREFLGAIAAFAATWKATGASPKEGDSNGRQYGMGINVDRCIGCAKCMEACKIENDVPPGPFYFRTWVERYTIRTDQEVTVECIGRKEVKPKEPAEEKDILRTFFIPKLCNHCAHPPCVQVCPVGATFATKEGNVLVDDTRCIGCGYCVQACPYGSRYLDPRTKTAAKCTFCYHRLAKGLLPACVEVCPTQTRVFGDLNSKASPLTRFRRMNRIDVLKPGLNTEPRVYYSDLDGVVQ